MLKPFNKSPKEKFNLVIVILLTIQNLATLITPCYFKIYTRRSLVKKILKKEENTTKEIFIQLLKKTNIRLWLNIFIHILILYKWSRHLRPHCRLYLIKYLKISLLT